MKTYSKKDVAKSQLEEAIKLFFEMRDPISIHTLVGAAHQILRDTASTNGIEYRCIVESMAEELSDDIRKFYKAAFQPRNFFKHANLDSTNTLKFDGEENELWLLDTCVLYHQVVNETSDSITAFWSWYIIKSPQILSTINMSKMAEAAERLQVDEKDFSFFRGLCGE